MSDERSSYEEQLPWLQSVDDEDEPRGVSARKMLAALGVVLIAALLVGATFFWIGRRECPGQRPARADQGRPGAVQDPAAQSGRPRYRRRKRDRLRDQRGPRHRLPARHEQGPRAPRAARRGRSPSLLPDSPRRRPPQRPLRRLRSRSPSRRARPVASSSSARSRTGRRPSEHGRHCRRAFPVSPRSTR